MNNVEAIDERYFLLLATAIRACKQYQPKFGQGRSAGLTNEQFHTLYSADPFYHWLGLDSGLMYTAHKVAGGMTSIYRQIGIGSQWIFHHMLQDFLGLSPQQATWNYQIDQETSTRTLSLDGRIEIDAIRDVSSFKRVQNWLMAVSEEINLPSDSVKSMKGVVFEVRQGYKSKDSKRQNADIANAAKAYAHLYIPAIVLFSNQIDSDIAHRYREHHWLLLTGSLHNSATKSTYAFCRDVIGYDLAGFFERYTDRLRLEIEDVLKTLLTI